MKQKKTKSFLKMKDCDIARQIAGDAGLDGEGRRHERHVRPCLSAQPDQSRVPPAARRTHRLRGLRCRGRRFTSGRARSPARNARAASRNGTARVLPALDHDESGGGSDRARVGPEAEEAKSSASPSPAMSGGGWVRPAVRRLCNGPFREAAHVGGAVAGVEPGRSGCDGVGPPERDRARSRDRRRRVHRQSGSPPGQAGQDRRNRSTVQRSLLRDRSRAFLSPRIAAIARASASKGTPPDEHRSVSRS